MLLKLLIYFIAGVLIYRFAKSLFGSEASPPDKVQDPASSQVDDVMIQDPHCGAYFPQRKGFSLEKDGKSLQFCSEKCRNLYQKQDIGNRKPGEG